MTESDSTPRFVCGVCAEITVSIARMDAVQGEPDRNVQRGIAMIAEAARHKLWISSPTLSRAPDGSMHNTLFLFGPDGSLVASYNTNHLFSRMQECLLTARIFYRHVR